MDQRRGGCASWAPGHGRTGERAGANTLYLPGQQLTLNTTTQATTGVHYHTLPDGGQVIH